MVSGYDHGTFRLVDTSDQFSLFSFGSCRRYFQTDCQPKSNGYVREHALKATINPEAISMLVSLNQVCPVVSENTYTETNIYRYICLYVYRN
jgi:hypothetical protein